MGYIRWLGHSAFELELSGRRILIDPWISNPMSPARLDEFRDVDYVVVTHDHGDHLGEALEVLRISEKAKLVSIYEIAEWASKQIGEGRAIGGNIGGPMLVEDDLKFMLVPATHSSARGMPTGVVIMGREATVYHAGDTGLTAEMGLLGELYRIDIAMLPIGGHFTMDPFQAAKAVELLKPRVAIPMHYGTFPVLYGKPEDFARFVEEMGLDTRVLVLRPGERIDIERILSR